MADFTLTDGGSVLLLKPSNDAAEEWLSDHIGEDNGYQPYWPTVVIETRYVEAILEGITDDGFEVDV